jgi:hypothetical protein
MTTKQQQRRARRRQVQQSITRQMSQVAIKPKPKKNKPFATVGQTLGSAVGSMFGAPTIGSGVGRWLGKGIGSIFGSGDYEMVGQAPSYNVLVNGAQIPKFSSTRQTNIVCHREYIGDITGTTGFTNRKYPLNPGSATTFPWLSTIAQNYQQYKIHGLIFEFRPLITDFVTAGAPGVVIMATNYNADEPVYTSKQAMENSEYAVSVKPTCNLMHGVECASNQTVLSELYVRPKGLASGLDLKFTDLGNFQLASQGNPTQLLGELWVSYNIEFFKPLLPEDVGGDVESIYVNRISFNSANPLGIIGVSSRGDLTDFVITPTSLSWLVQPNNNYLVSLHWQGTTPGVTTYPGLSATNLTAVSIWNNSTSANITAPESGAVTGSMQVTFLFKASLTSPGTATMNFTAAGLYPTGTQSLDIVITPFTAGGI